MAYKHVPFYNLELAVGPGAPNQRADVMLVQYFLRELYAHPDFIADRPAGVMTIDGRFGPVTALWIDQFQKRLKKRGLSVLNDGRVDPARGELLFSKGSISSERYTIWHLNLSYRKRFQRSHDHLESDPRVPTELAATLAVNELSNAG